MKQEMELKDLTREVCEVAKRAGAYISGEREKFSLERVERKHAHDYVSYVDKGSEKLIVSALRQLLPDAGFITEEGLAGHDAEQRLWVIDPLDGTTNFIHRYAPYAVSIALLHVRFGSDGPLSGGLWPTRRVCRAVPRPMGLHGRQSDRDGGWWNGDRLFRFGGICAGE